jgi:putative hydrolase of the HAD superfamily
MSGKPVEAVLFDLGGTLLHYQDGNEPTFRRMTLRGLARIRAALIEFGHTLPPEEEFGERVDDEIGPAFMASIAELRGGTIETPIRRALEEMDITPNDELWVELRARFYSAVDEIVRPRAGIHETLTALTEQGLKLAIISNTFWAADLHDRHLRKHNLIDLLPQRTYSCDTPHVKPHPSIFLDALAGLSVEPERAVYVGDRLDIDVGGAQDVGMRGVLIISPYIQADPDEQTRAIQPDATIQELPGLLDKLAQWG